MALAGVHDFELVCKNQGVDLDPRILYGGRTQSDYSFCPYGPLDLAIAICSELLSTDHKAVLANRTIDVPPDGDMGLRTLTAIINARTRKLPCSPDNFFVSGDKYLDTCSEFEDTMISSLEGLRSSHPSGGDVIVDSAESPIFFRKPYGEPSALALQPINISGVPYPAGSIIRVDTEDAYELDVYGDGKFHSRNPRVSESDTRVIPSEQVVGATFLRLSAFAYESYWPTLLQSEDVERLRKLECMSLLAMTTIIQGSVGLA